MSNAVRTDVVVQLLEINVSIIDFFVLLHTKYLNPKTKTQLAFSFDSLFFSTIQMLIVPQNSYNSYAELLLSISLQMKFDSKILLFNMTYRQFDSKDSTKTIQVSCSHMRDNAMRKKHSKTAVCTFSWIWVKIAFK